jgi:3-oxoacyl-[acyl-carrier-protein] synthase-3
VTAPRRFAALRAVAGHVPDTVVDNAPLDAELAPVSVAKIAAKTGIDRRRVVAPGETTADLAVAAAEALFREQALERASIDFVLLCTQTPDHAMPSTSCLVQDRLGLRTDIGAFDLGMGCSGYVYGLGAASALIDTGQADSVLLLTADTLSRYVNPSDAPLRTIFGDGASATLVTASAGSPTFRGFSYGTDGSGARHLIVPTGGLAPAASPGARGLESNGHDLFMDGAEVFGFALRAVPRAVAETLARADLTLDDIDAVVLHQANAFMLETLRRKLDLSPEKFVVEMSDVGNTTSSSIPLALAAALRTGQVRPGMRLLLVGFGVGLSWGAVVVDL